MVGILYLVSPIDFIPDVFLPFGIIDDAGAPGASGYYQFYFFQKMYHLLGSVFMALTMFASIVIITASIIAILL